MCVGLPGQVVELLPDRPDFARVSIAGAVRDVSLVLFEDDRLEVGDWVVVQLGLALERMTETEANEAMRVLEALGQASEDDLFLDLEELAETARSGPFQGY